MDENKKLEWTALEYEERNRDNDWYWALGIIVVAGSIASFIYGNLFFGIFLILSGLLIVLFTVKRPDLVFYEINEKGLKIKNRLYPYQNIKSFWIKIEEDEEPTLFLHSERQFMPILSVPIKQENAGKIKELMLSNDVLEQEMKEHISEKIMDSLGF